MPARFFCQTGPFAGSSFEIAEEAVIGRNQDDVRLPAEIVSGTHARIYFDADRDGYFLEDLGSRNGTKLDGMPVEEPVKLGKLHVVTFADQIDFIYHEGEGLSGARAVETPAAVEHTQPQRFAPGMTPPSEGPTSGTNTIRTEAYTPGALPSDDRSEERQTIRTNAYTPGALPDEEDTIPEQNLMGDQTMRTEAYTPGALPEAKAGAEPDPGQQTRLGGAFKPTPNLPGGAAPTEQTPRAEPSVRFSIEVTRGERSVTFPLNEGENSVGRASNCVVSIDDKSVSREHAVLIVRDGRVTLRDLGSRNHTYVDDARVESDTEVPLGAVLRFGLESRARLRRA